MESPLNARDFIKRFHLPQLVRISSLQHNEEPAFSRQISKQNTPPARPPNSSFQTNRSERKPDRDQVEAEAGGWIFLSPNKLNHSTSQRQASDGEMGADLDEEDQFGDLQFRSLAQISVRMPRVTLASSNSRSHASSARWSLERQSPAEEVAPRGQDERKGALIKLAPPSKRPTLSKLHLNQPFLLYKAYRKLELCAYAMDSKNELNEKSGDPIYFPHNYPGKFGGEREDKRLGASTWRAKEFCFHWLRSQWKREFQFQGRES